MRTQASSPTVAIIKLFIVDLVGWQGVFWMHRLLEALMADNALPDFAEPWRIRGGHPPGQKPRSIARQERAQSRGPLRQPRPGKARNNVAPEVTPSRPTVRLELETSPYALRQQELRGVASRCKGAHLSHDGLKDAADVVFDKYILN